MKTKKDNVIVIDLNEWCTQATKAAETGKHLSTISQQVVRSIKGKTKSPVDYWEIKELGITLVKRHQ